MGRRNAGLSLATPRAYIARIDWVYWSYREMFSAGNSIYCSLQAGTWLYEHDSVMSRPTWMGLNRAPPVGPSGCDYFKIDCNGDYRRGRVGLYG
jgi:hypothetical protein